MPDETLDPPTAPPAARTDHAPAGNTTSPDRAAPATTVDEPLPAVPGYELVGVIGKGGIGVVYRARDVALDRDVAVKVLQDRFPADGPSARRFVEEARITGQLQHPGIPAVHQVGALPDGRPFLAMKLIKGRALDAILAGRDRPNLLAVFEQICQAVAYAHAHHVIHRDLKPANVMVGAFGEVQVMDWGLAKVLTSGGVHPRRPAADPDATLGTEIRSLRGENEATQAGSLLGTPAYMAPEQALGAVNEIDTRTDVFGLGAVLCALLTGKPPFVGGDAESTRLLAARGELGDAYARLDASGAEPDLVALAKRCLAVKRDDRPADAGAVAAAVHDLRAAADERARQAELSEAEARVRAAAERKRRKHLMVAAGLVTGVLAAGVAGTAVGLRHAERKRQDAEAAEGREADQRRKAGEERDAKEAARRESVAAGDRAAKARDRARAALDAMTSSVIGDSLTAQKSITDEQKKFLAEVLTYYKEFAGEIGNDEVARWRTATAAYRVGTIEERLGRKEEATAAIRLARDGFAALAADFPASRAHRRDLATCHHNLGILLARLGRLREAEAAFRAAVAVQEKLAADFPALPESRSELACSHSSLGLLLTNSGRRAEAEAAYRAALAVQEKLAADFTAKLAYRAHLAMSHDNLGALLANLRRQEEAETAFRAAFAIWERLVADAPAAPEYRLRLATSYNYLATLLTDLGRRAEAEAAYRAGLAISEKLVADFPAVPDYQIALGGNFGNFGRLVHRSGMPAESLPWFAKAVATLDPVVAREPQLVPARRSLQNAHSERAMALMQLERYADAMNDWDKATVLGDGRQRDSFRLQRALCLARTHPAKAVVEAADLTGEAKLNGLPPAARQGLQYDAACVYSLASARLTGDAKDRAAAQAIVLLAKLRDGGYFLTPTRVVHALYRDADLDPLRGRVDFRAFAATLPKVREPVPPPRPAK